MQAPLSEEIQTMLRPESELHPVTVGVLLAITGSGVGFLVLVLAMAFLGGR